MTTKNELEKVRALLNSMILSDEHSAVELLKVSQELDVLVMRSMKEKEHPESLINGENKMDEWEGMAVRNL